MQAIIKNGEIRCPVCGRKHGEINEDTVIIGFKIQCRGRKGGAKHSFEVNFTSLSSIVKAWLWKSKTKPW